MRVATPIVHVISPSLRVAVLFSTRCCELDSEPDHAGGEHRWTRASSRAQLCAPRARPWLVGAASPSASFAGHNIGVIGHKTKVEEGGDLNQHLG
jgi:hypothetical protein